MSKPAFDPNKPFEAVQDHKPAFDPNAPFEAVDDEIDPVGLGLGALGATAKGLDVLRGSITAPALAAALEAMTGKDVYRPEEHSDAVTINNLNTFPTSSELFERAGVPEGAKMSDVVGGYADPQLDNPWYQPEKGGMLDFTVRGAGGLATDMAIDPLSWLSMGGAQAGKQALSKSASREVLQNAMKKGTMAKIGEMVAAPFQAGAKFIAPTKTFETIKTKLGAPGRMAAAAITSPSDALKRTGKRLYDSVLQPLEHEGQVFGKKEIGETAYNAGIKTPFGLRGKAGEATDTLMTARDQILREADAAGGKVDIPQAMTEARNRINDLRALKDSDAAALADNLEAKIVEWETTAKGTPDVPDTISMTRGPVGKGPYGETRMGDVPVVVKGKKGKAPSPYTATEGSNLKSFLYSETPNSVFHENLNAPVSARVKSSMSKGFKEGTEDAVAGALGAEKAADLAELNQEAGKLLATRKAQTRVSNQTERNLTNLGVMTGTDTVTGGVGAAVKGDMGGGVESMALKKLLDGLRLMTMPAGYGMQKLSEGAITAPLIDAYVRAKFKEKAGRGSEEARRKRGEEE